MPNDRLACASQRAIDELSQLEEEAPQIVSFQATFLLEDLVDPTESGNVARFVEQVMEAKLLQCRQRLRGIRKLIMGKDPQPPITCVAAQACVDGKKVEINELLSAALDWNPVDVAQMRFPTTKGFFLWRLDDRSICCFLLIHASTSLRRTASRKGVNAIGYLFHRVAQDSRHDRRRTLLTSGYFQLLCVFGHIALTQAILRPRVGYSMSKNASLYFLPDGASPVQGLRKAARARCPNSFLL